MWVRRVQSLCLGSLEFDYLVSPPGWLSCVLPFRFEKYLYHCFAFLLVLGNLGALLYVHTYLLKGMVYPVFSCHRLSWDNPLTEKITQMLNKASTFQMITTLPMSIVSLQQPVKTFIYKYFIVHQKYTLIKIHFYQTNIFISTTQFSVAVHPIYRCRSYEATYIFQFVSNYKNLPVSPPLSHGRNANRSL